MTLLLKFTAAVCFAGLISSSVAHDAANLSSLKKYKRRMIDDDDLNCPALNSKYPVLLPHPEDCGKFYICDTGVPHLKICQSGLHFNPKIKACDYPRNAQCDTATEKPEGRGINDDLDSCPAVNSRYPVYLPHPEDCNKFFICDSGLRHLKVCQSGLHFNPKINACDYPEKAGCGPGSSIMPKERIMDDDLTPCPTTNSKYPVLLPHPEDCSKFYICDTGVPHLKVCQSGLHFNSKIKACDYPRNAECDAEKPEGRMNDDDLDSCPAVNPRYPVYLPHPEDCNKFFICDSGSRHLKVCQSGLHFNPKINACDYPEKAGCVSGGSRKSEVRKVKGAFRSCPDDDSGIVFHHEEDCRLFYTCDDGIASVRMCPEGLHFNPMIMACDYPEEAGCSTEKSEDGMFSEDFMKCPAESFDKPVFIPHPKDCDLFYQCDHGFPTLRRCPVNLHFNPKTVTCDFPFNAGCDIETADKLLAGVPSPYCPSTDGKHPIFYRHPTNCSIYYMCSHGLAHEFVCPARLHFNVRKKVCDYEKNAGCQNS